MVQLTKIYTRGGDHGETSLGDGSRVAKHDARVEAYGTVDEANAVIGLVRVEIVSAGVDEQALDAVLGRIQNDLFDLGAPRSKRSFWIRPRTASRACSSTPALTISTRTRPITALASSTVP